MNGTDAGTGSDPVLQVLRGAPDAAELAALLLVVLSRSAPPAPPPAASASWSGRAMHMRRAMYVGPGGWRSS